MSLSKANVLLQTLVSELNARWAGRDSKIKTAQDAYKICEQIVNEWRNNTMEFKQLLIADNGDISEQQQAFLSLHKEIIFCGNTAANYAVKMAQKLKEMNDSKLYEQAGFDSFGDYCEQAAGIKERQAYSYMSVINKLPQEFLQSNANLGITKLALLATASASDRNELVEENNLESATVKELKALIAEKDAKIEQLAIDLDSKELPAPVINVSDEEIGAKAQAIADAQIEGIKADIKAATERAAKIKADLDKKEKELAASKQSAENLKKQLDEEKNKPVKTETVEDTAKLDKLSAEISELNKDVEYMRLEKEKAEKALAVAQNPLMTEFKYKFGTLQELMNGLLGLLEKMSVDDATKCTGALKKLVERWSL